MAGRYQYRTSAVFPKCDKCGEVITGQSLWLGLATYHPWCAPGSDQYASGDSNSPSPKDTTNE